MKYILILAVTLLAMSCTSNYENYDKKVVHMRIISIDPPKHVYADLVNEETGEIWYNIHVSKHCYNWRSIPPNAQIDMYEYSYSHGDRKYRELNGREIYEKFCY